MVLTAPQSERLYELSLRQGQVKRALKTALACCLAIGAAYYYHLPSKQLAPVFVYLIMTTGQPSPRLNWLLTQLAVSISALVSAMILLVFHDATYPYLAITLLWIFTCLLFSIRFPLPATLGAMVSAIGLFVFFEGPVGSAINFYFYYGTNFLIAGLAIVVVQTFLWPLNSRHVFLERLAGVYARLEDDCRDAARRVRSAEPAPVEELAYEWAPFRALRQLVAPELRRAGVSSNPFARMILAARSLNLRIWFFNRALAPAASNLPAAMRQQIASILDRCAEHLHTLLDGAVHGKSVAAIDAGLLRELNQTRQCEADVMLVHGIHATVLCRLLESLRAATEAHNALYESFRKGLTAEFAALQSVARNTRLFDVQSVRSGVKLVLIIVLLMLEQGWVGLPGGSQVAFYATFFASTGNLGRQNKTDLLGVAGLLLGFAYGFAAAYITSCLPHFVLLLLLVFLGQFLANLAFQRLPRFGVAGLQAGLAFPFAYLATTGPAWGSFDTVQTRFSGLVFAGFTALVVHAYLWPVLPMRQLRELIAAALRATAASITQLFGDRANWDGAPPSLSDTVTHARDLLDDARYLPGPEHADPAYNGILGCLTEIDANLEFIHFLVGLELEHPLRQRFFQVSGDYSDQARRNLDTVCLQFQWPPSRGARVEPVRWQPHTSARWESASRDVRPEFGQEIDPWRPVVIARCLDQIARAVERISEIVDEINGAHIGR